MSTPVTSSLIPNYDDEGNLTGYTQALTQEKFDRKDYLSVDTRFVTSGENSRGQTFLERQMSLAMNPETRELAELEQAVTPQQLEQQNRLVEQRNNRIGTLIATVSNSGYNGDVKSLWNWWDQYNETAYQDYKPERSQSSEQDLTLLDGDGTGSGGGGGLVGECLSKERQ